MNFFKKLFSKKEGHSAPNQTKQILDNFQGIGSKEYFDKRYEEDHLDPSIMDGVQKMITGYYLDNKLNKANTDHYNHPKNLDQVVEEGMGYHMYCQALKMEDHMTVGTLAMAFAAFMMDTLDFKLYKDNEPEYPMRAMTIKFDKSGTVLSLYPMEYAIKVLQGDATFEALYDRIINHLKQLPTADELLKNIMKS